MVLDPAPTSRQSPDAFVGQLARSEVQRNASSVPGREIVQVLVEIPVGVESGVDHHEPTRTCRPRPQVVQAQEGRP